MEPSQYIVNLKKLLDSKEKLYNEYLQDINNSLKELETNLDLYKKKVYSLENVKSTLLNEIKNYNDLLEKTNVMENNNKYNELTEKLKTLLSDKDKIESQINQNLIEINNIENSIISKEKTWHQNKSKLINELSMFESNILVPSLKNMEDHMLLTKSNIDGLNTQTILLLTPNTTLDDLEKEFNDKNAKEILEENIFEELEGPEETEELEEEITMFFGKPTDSESENDSDEEIEDSDSDSEEENSDDENSEEENENNFGKIEMDSDEDDSGEDSDED